MNYGCQTAVMTLLFFLLLPFNWHGLYVSTTCNTSQSFPFFRSEHELEKTCELPLRDEKEEWKETIICLLSAWDKNTRESICSSRGQKKSIHMTQNYNRFRGQCGRKQHIYLPVRCFHPQEHAWSCRNDNIHKPYGVSCWRGSVWKKKK